MQKKAGNTKLIALFIKIIKLLKKPIVLKTVQVIVELCIIQIVAPIKFKVLEK